MSYNRQNFRPAGNNFGTYSCAVNRPATTAACATPACATPACGSPCPTMPLDEMPLGMAYVPWQTFGTMYPMSQGLRRGTMFPCLDFDFMGRRCN